MWASWTALRPMLRMRCVVLREEVPGLLCRLLAPAQLARLTTAVPRRPSRQHACLSEARPSAARCRVRHWTSSFAALQRTPQLPMQQQCCTFTRPALSVVRCSTQITCMSLGQHDPDVSVLVTTVTCASSAGASRRQSSLGTSQLSPAASQ